MLSGQERSLSVIPPRPLDFGEILDAAFQVYRRDFFDYTVIAVVGLAPSYVALGIAESRIGASSLGGDAASAAQVFSVLSSMVGWLAVGATIAAVAWTALAAGIAARARDRRPAFAPSYRQALGRAPAVLGAGVLAVFCVALVMVGVSLLVGIAGAVLGNFGPVGVGVAILVLIVPAAVWFMSSTFGVLPAIVVEKTGPFNAFRRSFRLAGGARLRIFGLLCIAWIMLTLPSLALQSIAYGFSNVFSTEPAAAVSASKYWLVSLGSLAIGSVTTPLLVSCMMLLYYDRRVRVEAYNLEVAAGAMGVGSLGR